MKKLYTILAIIIAFTASAECIIPSTNGYQVHVQIQPTALQISNNGGGCTYKVVLQYSVTFTGNNIPNNLYTLQATIACGSQTPFFSLPTSGGTGNVLSATASYNGDCSALTVENFCNTINLSINGPGIPAQVVQCNFSALPITLVSFTTSVYKEHVHVDWATASEKDNDRFLLEQSTDGYFWQIVGQVSGAGTTSDFHNYQFDHYTSIPNQLVYYRLTQVDFNGESETFNSFISVVDTRINEPAIYSRTNTIGQQVDESYRGLVIVTHSNGKTTLKLQ